MVRGMGEWALKNGDMGTVMKRAAAVGVKGVGNWWNELLACFFDILYSPTSQAWFTQMV